ncbi:MAG TPA: sodium:solute symporter, partial [Salinivirgaceae bacterium]|nr:sodium:solute symporter [Salinivirgaceae bacterium]
SHDQLDTPKAVKVRKWVHALISIVMIGVIIVFNAISNDSVISAIFKVAGYTYGPLLGMFAFGIFNKRTPSGWIFPIFAILSPTISYLLQFLFQKHTGYQMGFELLLLNGFITYCAIYFFSKKK